MQREIIFRGKRVVTNKWVYGYLWESNSKRAYIKDSDMKLFETISETVGQFTGLLDKSGTKIFENDLLGCWVKDVNKKDKLLLCRVAFNEGSFVVDISRYLDGKLFSDLKTYLEDYVVVGNIHDNADLLPQNEKQL